MSKKGFTLIELLIIIIILGVLAALISGNFITSLKKGRDSRRITDLEQIQKSLEMYYEDQKAYPNTLTFDGQLVDAVSGKIYMAKVPNDPISGKNYEYKLTSGSYRLYACMENNQQKLPYNGSLTVPPAMTCNTSCFYQNGTTTPANQCIWAISSPDVNP